MQYSKRGVPEMLPKVEETLGVMCKEWIEYFEGDNAH